MGTVPLDLHTVHRHRLLTLQHDVYCGVKLAAQQCVQIVQRQPPHVLTVDGHDEIANLNPFVVVARRALHDTARVHQVMHLPDGMRRLLRHH